MKRTFKRPDGTEEVFEGTAEELAEYERKLNEHTRPPTKPDVLHGASLDGQEVTVAEIEFLRSWRKLLTSPDTFRVPYQTQPYVQPYVPYQPPIIQPSPSWPGEWYTITCSDQTVTQMPLTLCPGGTLALTMDVPSLTDILMGAPFKVDTNLRD